MSNVALHSKKEKGKKLVRIGGLKVIYFDRILCLHEDNNESSDKKRHK